MSRAFVALLLALTGQSPDAPPPPASSPATLTETAPMSQGRLLGAWRATNPGPRPDTTFEVAFSQGTRPDTVFGHFHFDDGDEARTLRQIGRVMADRVNFVLADGRQITLRLDATGRRLLGTIAERGRESTFELSRWRQRD